MTQRPQSDLFCVVCGGSDPVADGECAACITRNLEVARAPQKRVYVEVCRHCGAVPVRDGWRTPPSQLELVEQEAIGGVEVHPGVSELKIGVSVEQRDTDTFWTVVDLSGVYRKVPVESEVPVEVRIHGVSCPACSRRHGGYFEATLQLRREGDGEVTEAEARAVDAIVDEEVRRLGGLTGGLSYLLKVEPVHDGFDYVFGTMAAARAVAKRLEKRFAGKAVETVTVHGRRDGRDIHRLTVALKIPLAQPGAYLGLDGELLQVVTRHGNRLLTRRLLDGAKRSLEEREVERALVKEPRVLEVVFNEGGEGQVLDPDTYEAVDVRLPDDVRAGDTVEAVLYEGLWHVVGRAGPD